MLFPANLQASDGWTYYFKKKYRIVDRHIDKYTVAIPKEDEEKLNTKIDTFNLEKMPTINQYAKNKVQ